MERVLALSHIVNCFNRLSSQKKSLMQLFSPILWLSMLFCKNFKLFHCLPQQHCDNQKHKTSFDVGTSAPTSMQAAMSPNTPIKCLQPV